MTKTATKAKAPATKKPVKVAPKVETKKVEAKAEPKKVVQLPADSIADTSKIKAVILEGVRPGSKIHTRLAKIKPGMTVADVLANTEVTRFDLGCAIPKGRVVLAK